ncbi:MAG: signal peptidase II [Anaerolineales bacterium]|nr:signal peptidase II [Anaerolineales bacterium]
MNTFFKKYFSLFLTVGFVVLLDQWTKWLVRSNIPLNGSWLPDSLTWLEPYARVVFIYNKGAAFGMFQNGNIIFTVIAFLVLGGILYLYNQINPTDWILRLASALYLAGVLGNLIDRLMFGQVTDFISIGTFYIFNVADASINIGVVLLLIGYWRNERNKPSSTTDEMLSSNGGIS